MTDRRLLNALDVGAGAGVDADCVADINEKRDLDFGFSFECSRLESGGLSIAFVTGFGIGDLEIHLDR